MEKEGSWVTIIDYVNLKGVSISTVRRRIKAKKIKYRLEDGKYFIHVAEHKFGVKKIKNKEGDNSKEELTNKNEEYKKAIHKLKEELEDLKMLVSIYETEKQVAIDEELIPELPET